MEALVDLRICENEVGVCYAQQVVYVEIHLNSRFIFNELENGNPTRWYINQCSFSSHFAYNLTAHLDKLVMIVCQRIEKYCRNINIRFLSIPRSIVTATKARNHNLPSNLDRIILMASFEKCIFDPVNDLVPNLEVLFVHLLVDVDRFYKLLDVLQFSLRLNT